MYMPSTGHEPISIPESSLLGSKALAATLWSLKPSGRMSVTVTEARSTTANALFS